MADLFVTHRNVVTKLAKPMLGSGAGGYVEEVRPHVCTELRLEGHPPFVIPCTPSPFDDYEKSQSEWFETVVVPGWNRLSNEKAAHAHEELDRIVERGSVIPRRRITELMASLMLRGIPLPNDGGEPLAERAVRAFRTRVSAEKN